MTDRKQERATVAILAGRSENVNENYYAAVEACGARTLEAPVGTAIEEVLSADGILIPGGVDIDPEYYHEENTHSEGIDRARDEYQLGVLRAATREALPILGICRGLQLLNVFFGGTLCQNVAHCEMHKREGQTDKVHRSQVERGSFLYDIYHAEEIAVNSAHHQAIGRLGEGLVPVQYSPDGLIEAVVHTTLPIWAVQWHPERMCLKNARTDTVDGLEVFRFYINQLSGR